MKRRALPDEATSAAQSLDEVDLDLLAQLSELYQVLDPVPAGLVDRIGFALTLVELEAELASIQSESAPLVGARGEERARTVTFSSDSLTVMVTITPSGRGEFRLDGWLAPAAALQAELRCAREDGRTSVRTTADVDGRFEFDTVPEGLIQLVFHPTAGVDLDLRSPVVTPAVEL